MGDGRKKAVDGKTVIAAELVDGLPSEGAEVSSVGSEADFEMELDEERGPGDHPEYADEGSDEEELSWDDLVVVDIPDPQELMRDVLEQAWKDGKVTEDEQGLLDVLRKRLGVTDKEYGELLEELRPKGQNDPAEHATVEGHYESWGEAAEAYIVHKPPLPTEGPDSGLEISPLPPTAAFSGPDMGTVGRPTDIITLRTSVRGERPLSHSFDLDHKSTAETEVRRCPSCRAQIKLRSPQCISKCPLCGAKIGADHKEHEGIRKVLDMAKDAYKVGNLPLAKDLYTTVLASSPGNKEALFYIQKIGIGTKAVHRQDLSNIRSIPLGNHRLDALMKGGIEVGSQVLIKGPPFCGKELIVEAFLAASLKNGLPVIYVSSNRAMKEVVRGITEVLPDFKEYNRDGMVRIFDLFSRHQDDMVLKEGHRIFNIQDKADFLRFQNDLILVLEELKRTYSGGALIISSLSPLINHTDQVDLMKFLQVLIARSKSYNFTNLYDIAASVHPEEVTNSVEYLMDGIAEFREKEGKNSLRLKGFKQGVESKDWIEYSCDGRNLVLTSSFHEQRIL